MITCAAQLDAELKLWPPQEPSGGPSRQSSLRAGPHPHHRPRAQTAQPALGWQLHDTARQLRPGSGRERSSTLQDSNARLKSGMIRKFVRVSHSICALPNTERASRGTDIYRYVESCHQAAASGVVTCML